METNGLLPYAQNAPHTESDTYPELNIETRLHSSNFVFGLRQIRTFSDVGRTVNGNLSLIQLFSSDHCPICCVC